MPIFIYDKYTFSKASKLLKSINSNPNPPNGPNLFNLNGSSDPALAAIDLPQNVLWGNNTLAYPSGTPLIL